MRTSAKKSSPRHPSERRAAWWYRRRGYRVLATNCWAGGYELDLVVRRGRALVFVEVKSKAGPRFGDPLEMVTPVKVERVRRAARRLARREPGARRPRAALRRRRGACGSAGGRAGRVLADVEPRPVATQEQLYAGLDLDLSWSERDLPERVRTKHVHRLHPYLGKYIPQLVEELFRRHVPPRGRVLDPFAGSGTTLVQALESGLDSAGVDIASFNCLLTSVKTREHNPFVLERELRDALARFERGEGAAERATPYLRAWFAPCCARRPAPLSLARRATTSRRTFCA